VYGFNTYGHVCMLDGRWYNHFQVSIPQG
jgi:hypothetical protein